MWRTTVSERAPYNNDRGRNPAIVTYAVSFLSSELPQFIDACDHKNACTRRWPKGWLRCNVGYRTLRFSDLDQRECAQRLVFVN